MITVYHYAIPLWVKLIHSFNKYLSSTNVLDTLFLSDIYAKTYINIVYQNQELTLV